MDLTMWKFSVLEDENGLYEGALRYSLSGINCSSHSAAFAAANAQLSEEWLMQVKFNFNPP